MNKEPVWKDRYPSHLPPPPTRELTLPCGDSVHLGLDYRTEWSATFCVLVHADAATVEAAQELVVPKLIEKLKQAALELRLLSDDAKRLFQGDAQHTAEIMGRT